jgi:hypothetical protein
LAAGAEAAPPAAVPGGSDASAFLRGPGEIFGAVLPFPAATAGHGGQEESR